MNIRIAQLFVSRSVEQNKTQILDALRLATPGDWVAFPEGALSGYQPEASDYLADLDPKVIDAALDEISLIVQTRRCHCLLGSATHLNGRWFNSVIVIDASGNRFKYDKIELAGLDRHHFTPGDTIFFQCLDQVSFGTLACRELLFPARWIDLKQRGAQIVFHLNNAIKPHDAIWEHLLIGRALENSVFVCSVNSANSPQALASYVVAPSGRVLLKSDVQTQQILTAQLDLSEVIPDLRSRADF
jgi:predicted amidohydrolase